MSKRRDDRASDDDALFEEALDLVIRLQNDPANTVAQDLVRRWRARGPDHEAAWAAVAEIHGMAGKVLEQRSEGARPDGLSRRNMLLGGAAAIGVFGTGALFGDNLFLRARADHMTSTAELRRVSLPDSSVITLGPDSAIRTAFTPSERKIELLAGMLFLDVAADPARPFRAVAGALEATAFGTAFELASDAGTTTVSVDHGVVEARMTALPQQADERLAAGDRLLFDEGAGTAERGTLAADQIAAWRGGLIVADRETVAAVVARIARWRAGSVLIADPDLGRQRISGVFGTGDTLAALEAVVQPHGAHVRQISPWFTVISPI